MIVAKASRPTQGASDASVEPTRPAMVPEPPATDPRGMFMKNLKQNLAKGAIYHVLNTFEVGDPG